MVFWLNAFPHCDGISQTLSPREIVTRMSVDFTKHCKVEFGSYVQTHEHSDNSMNDRTIGAIALRPSGNAQGGHYFLSLNTGLRIHRHKWTPLPMPNEVTERVDYLAQRGGMPRGLEFMDRAKFVLPDDYDDPDTTGDPTSEDSGDPNYYAPLQEWEETDDAMEEATLQEWEPEDDEDLIATEDAAADEELYNTELYAAEPGAQPEPPEVETVPEAEALSTHEDSPTDEIAAEIAAEDDRSEPAEHRSESAEDRSEPAADRSDESDIERAMNAKYGERTGHHHLRPRRPRQFGHVNAVLAETVMTQYNMGPGIKKFGQPAVEAVNSEMKQLHNRQCMEPVLKELLTEVQVDKTLEYLMFIKQKRCGKIKGRGCADGRKQRLYTSKDDKIRAMVFGSFHLVTDHRCTGTSRYMQYLAFPSYYLNNNYFYSLCDCSWSSSKIEIHRAGHFGMNEALYILSCLAFGSLSPSKAHAFIAAFIFTKSGLLLFVIGIEVIPRSDNSLTSAASNRSLSFLTTSLKRIRLSICCCGLHSIGGPATPLVSCFSFTSFNNDTPEAFRSFQSHCFSFDTLLA